MIQKLQNRFIRIAMCSMAVVLLVVALGINGLNLAWNLGVVKEKMQTLVSNGGVFLPDRPKEPPKEKWDSEERYRMRYFTVYVEESGNMICNTQHIVTVSDAEAKALAERLLKTGREEGLVKHCLYRVTECDTGKLILFVDCYPEIRQCGSLVLISLGIIVISFFLLFIPVKILSGRALRPVQEGFTRQKQFITDAGHEIKTPLSIISANVDVLALEGQENEWLKSIRNQVKRLSLLANDLSLLARMDEEELTSSVEEFSLSEAVREATSPFFSVAESQGKNFAVEIAPDLKMIGNENAIRQMVVILTDNAIKHSAGTGEIVLRLSSTGKQMILETENLCDLPEDLNLERLFDRFYRADPSRTRATGGSGLGLAIALRIAEQHRGTIHVRRAFGEKIHFIAVLPT